jgi:PmbA protein
VVALTKPSPDRVVSWAEEKGALEAEVFFSQVESIHILFEKKNIALSERKKSLGYGIRVVAEKTDGKSVGFAYSNEPLADTLKSTIDRALGVAKVKPPDPDFLRLQESSPIRSRKILIDSKIVEKDPLDLLELVQGMINTADTSKKIKTVSGSLSLSQRETSVSNSHGVSGDYQSSNAIVGVSATSQENESVGVGWDRFSSYTIDETAALRCAREASRLSILQLHPRKISPGKFPLLIFPEGFAQLLSNTLVPEVNAENVYNGDSPFCGRIGETVGSPVLSIYDHGILQDGVGSKPFDDEGYPTQKTELISKGILKNFLHNSYTSNRTKVDNTGNSYRSGGRQGAARYASEPSIAPTNLVLHPGRLSQDELIRQIDDGIAVKGFIGAHTANSRTGEFSLVLYCAFKIEKGEFVYPIREAVVGGSILDILRNTSEVGIDSKQLSSGSRVGIISPSLIVEDLIVAG